MVRCYNPVRTSLDSKLIYSFLSQSLAKVSIDSPIRDVKKDLSKSNKLNKSASSAVRLPVLSCLSPVEQPVVSQGINRATPLLKVWRKILNHS